MLTGRCSQRTIWQSNCRWHSSGHKWRYGISVWQTLRCWELRTLAKWKMNPFCVVFPLIVLPYLHRLDQLLEKSWWLAKLSEPPLFHECLIRVLPRSSVYQTGWVKLFFMKNPPRSGDPLWEAFLHSEMEVASILAFNTWPLKMQKGWTPHTDD